MGLSLVRQVDPPGGETGEEVRPGRPLIRVRVCEGWVADVGNVGGKVGVSERPSALLRSDEKTRGRKLGVAPDPSSATALLRAKCLSFDLRSHTPDGSRRVLGSATRRRGRRTGRGEPKGLNHPLVGRGPVPPVHGPTGPHPPRLGTGGPHLCREVLPLFK